MPRFVHFYPYRPTGAYGGLVALRTAEEGTRRLGDTVTLWFDAARARWTSDDPSPELASSAHGTGLKRALFPSTLYESERAAAAKLREAWSSYLRPGDTALLHTTYLASALPFIKGPRRVVYAYDLVWRAHAIDAAAGPKPLAPVRGLYAASVRHREHAALRAADKVALVGWDDFERVRALGTPAAWCPAGLPQPQISKRPNGQKVRVGFLGNFEHRATLDSALALIRSPVASAVDFEVVLGGWGSNSHPALARSGVTLLGPVSTPGEFWAQIDCAVVPVVSGTGMKVKIAEALLAGRSVITTPLGAAGFPPEIRSAMTVHQDLDHLDGATCRKAIARGNTGADISALEFSAAAQRFSDFVAAPTRSS